MSISTLESAPRASAKKRAPKRVNGCKESRAAHGGVKENRLVEEHLPLVRAVIGRLAMTLPAHVNSEDLYSAGLVGLLNAVRRFDPKGGSSFESYARVRIRGAVIDELRRMDWVPRSVHDKAKKVEHTMQTLAQRNGRMPSDMEMAGALKISEGEYERLLEQVRPASYVCLDSVHGGGEGETVSGTHDFIADDTQHDPGERAARRELARLVEARLLELPEAQRKVLALYYFEDLRLREIAEAFGVTESRICQVHAQGVLAIKALLRQQDPHIFSPAAAA
jgi:RNA polymerase sigma factor FliA